MGTGGEYGLIHGARVHLRHPVPDDEAAFRELVANSREIRGRWVRGPQTDGRTDARLWFQGNLGLNAAGNNERHFVVRNDDGALLGMLNFNEIVRSMFLSAYLGYWIGGPYARQGYMGEALRLGIHYAFAPPERTGAGPAGLGLHRLEANIQPDNAASIALVRSLGFRLEGLSPRYLKIDGVWRDHERWAITVEDLSGDHPSAV